MVDAPIRDFWAMTIHDVDTRTLIVNGTQVAKRNLCQPHLVKNEDSAVGLQVGPKAPAAFEENWRPAVPGKAWSVTFGSMPPPKPNSTGRRSSRTS
jgi:hypothetical protein